LISPLYELVVELPPSLAEAAAISLFAAGAAGLEERRSGRRARLVVWSERREPLQRWAQAVQRDLGPHAACRVAIRASGLYDWATRWTQHLRSVRLGNRFLVQPLTAAQRRTVVEPRRTRILLQPSLAFGLGDHPTTRLAARAVERWARAQPGGRLIDVGCGTGILGFIAVSSGAASALGIDIDGRAVQNARDNAALNRLAERCTFSVRRLANVRGRFELAVANIDASTLLGLAHDFRRLAPRIVLTGFLTQDEQRLADGYSAHGFQIERTEHARGWALLTLARPPGARDRKRSWAGRGKVARTRRARGL
jgi:ribosomal protein L11 methyltransferase